MKVKIIKPVTITVAPGQTVEAEDAEAKRAVALGFAEEVKETKAKRAAK